MFINLPPAEPRTRQGAANGGRGCCLVSVELQEVVSGGDQSPLGAAGGSAALLVGAAVVLDVREDRLDHCL
jgi:hypothetical protein